MQQGYLLGRVLLGFGEGDEVDAIIRNLSAAAFDTEGGLWLASDELEGERVTLSRLQPEGPSAYGNRRRFELRDFIELPAAGDDEDEADIEGLDVAGPYLWFTGSHASKRLKPKGKGTEKDLARLARITVERNRFLLGRIPLVKGAPARSAPHPHRSGNGLRAARLADGEGGNVLTAALQDDDHLGSFLRTVHDSDGMRSLLPLASKENGFDIEGLAVIGDRVFLGLRGPVLRGWAMLLEIEPRDEGEGRLGLAGIGDEGHRYRKHFLDLDGLGIRELARDGDDLLILAGPTMTLRGLLRVYRLRDVAGLNADKRGADSLTLADDARLTALFELPMAVDGDNAEGFARCAWPGRPGLLVVYDGPVADRRPAPGQVYADVFWLRG